MKMATRDLVFRLSVCLIMMIPNTWGILNSAKFDPPDDRQVSSINTNNYNHVVDEPLANPQISEGSLYIPYDPQHTYNRGERPEYSHSSSGIQIEMSSTTNLTGSTGQLLYFVVKNLGSEDEYIHINVSDEKGYARELPPTEFYLPSGSSQEISVRMDYPSNAPVGTPDMITVRASGKRNTVKRSAYYYPGNDYPYNHQAYQPFCFDRYVTGSCRYRMDPYYCDSYKWTAYATIQNPGGVTQLRSIPEGLYVPPEFYPGTKDRLRVYLTVSCCVPIVQFISVNPYAPNQGNSCIVDVREFQWLNPAEIAGIVIGIVAFFVIIIVIVVLLIRRRRNRSVLVGQTTLKTTEGTSRQQ